MKKLNYKIESFNCKILKWFGVRFNDLYLNVERLFDFYFISMMRGLMTEEKKGFFLLRLGSSQAKTIRT